MLLTLVPEAFAHATHVSFSGLSLVLIWFFLWCPESLYTREVQRTLAIIDAVLHVVMALLCFSSTNMGWSFAVLSIAMLARAYLFSQNWVSFETTAVAEEQYIKRSLVLGVWNIVSVVLLGVHMFRDLELGSHMKDLDMASYSACLLAEAVVSLLALVGVMGWPRLAVFVYEQLGYGSVHYKSQ